MKNKNGRSPRQGVEANGLNTYDCKKNLPDRALSPSVLLATMSGKEILKFNWLIKFSSWSGNWATLFTQKKKGNVSTFWPDTHCPPMCHRFPYVRFDMAPTFYLLREIGLHRYNRIFLMSPSLLSTRVRTLSMHPNSFCFLIIQIFGKSNILSVPW